MEMLGELGGMAKKTSKGRRKIEIKKIENTGSRQVTFSKRRLGLFKKACELSILSVAEIAIIVRSQSDRVFSFGYPTADGVIERFISGGVVDFPAAAEYNRRHYAEVCKELEAERKRGEEAKGCRMWFKDGVEGMGVEDLEEYAAALDELTRKVTLRADALMHSTTLVPPISAVLDDTRAFVVNQDIIHNSMWSGFDQIGHI